MASTRRPTTRCTASPGPRAGGYQSVDDPNGIGTTTINGVNDAGDLVGFYTDAAGNTDGLLAAPDNGSADLRRSH